jgi:phage terminase large subunit-like protein
MKKGEQYKQKALSYIDRVSSGERITGELELLAVQRHLDDLKHSPENGFYFDEGAAKGALSFFTLFHHFKGEWAGQEFVLEDWQAFIIWCIFGWKKKGGHRRFNYANVEVARKNGKTTLAAGIALLMLARDYEPGAEVYSAAVDKDQARICWDAAVGIAGKSPELKSFLTFWKNSIVMESTASCYKPLSKETKNKDGLSPHCSICDELHAWPTMDIYGLITTGMAARRQPLVFSITTAGKDMNCPYFAMRNHYINILHGIKKEENTFVMIFAMDKEDDWKDPKNWTKASPNLGISVKMEYMQTEFERALNQGGVTETDFKTKNLNQWVDAPDVWISDEKVIRCKHGTTEDDLIGKECYAGLDLASHVDINALALYFPTLPVPAVRFYFWIPEGKVLAKEDRVDYRQWKAEGHIRITSGDIIDIDTLVLEIGTILKKYDVKSLSYDPAKAYHGVIQGLQKEGFDEILDEFSQSMRNMSEPVKKVEADVTAGTVDLMGNPVIRWMFRNVAVYRDANDNIKLDKKKSPDKIDGVVAMANAYGGYMSEKPGDKYIFHGVPYVNF